ncbi:hypothetical protein [Novosphingobium sp. PhB55]|uniref:hypothetical protein n=1 Tax=Novosphingobium sp. PhB55 TaxID=2485106 RepID=UPI001AB0300B|nr:hypothetical protein [Novosphingobium sp. PhB55]
MAIAIPALAARAAYRVRLEACADMIAAMAHMDPSRQHYDCCPFEGPIGDVRKSATRPEFRIVGQLLEKSPAFGRVKNDRVWLQAAAVSLILETNR